MSQPKIYDGFLFFNEYEILKLRLELLYDVVDHFIIVESNITHSGIGKPYLFHSCRKEFEKYKDKIIHVPIQQAIQNVIVPGQVNTEAWRLENEQRNSILLGCRGAMPDDIILISDVDEIPSLSAIETAKQTTDPLTFIQLFHYYYLNCQHAGVDRLWPGTAAVRLKDLKEPQYFRKHHQKHVLNGGYHFSYMTDIETKLKAFAHQEYNKETVLNDTENKKTTLTDLFNRPGIKFTLVDFFKSSEYEPELKQIVRENFSHLLYDSANTTIT